MLNVPFIIFFVALFKFRFFLPLSKFLYHILYDTLLLLLYDCLRILCVCHFFLFFHTIVQSSLHSTDCDIFVSHGSSSLPQSDLHLLCFVYENLPASKVVVYYDKGNSQPKSTLQFYFPYSLKLLRTVVKCFFPPT